MNASTGREEVAAALLHAHSSEQDPEVLRDHIRLTLWFLLAFQSRRQGRCSPPTPLPSETVKTASSFRHPRIHPLFLRHLLSQVSRHVPAWGRTSARGAPFRTWPVYGHI